jgi:hypothetical protein
MLCGLMGVAACRDTPLAFGPSPAAARDHADQLLTGLQRRFTNIDRSPTAQATLTKIVRALFTPSRVYNDSSTWSVVQSDSVRLTTLAGHFVHDHYVVATVTHAPPPTELATSRDEIQLAQRGRGEYEWTSHVDQAIGSLAPDDADRLVGSMLAAVATTDEDALRSGTDAAFPRTSAILGQFFSLDTVRRAVRDDGTALVDLVIGLHPDRLSATYPLFAAYLRHYLNSTRLRGVLRGTDGQWFDVNLAGNRLDLRFRADRDGRFGPIDGPRHPMPDSLTLQWDFHTKIWVFSLGVSDLLSDFVVIRTPHTAGWRLSFRHEPRWHLPFAVDHLVKGSLRRPFSGNGARYDVLLTDSASGVTLLEREGDVMVQESTVMRWLGGLGTRVVGEFSGPTEAEESAYLATVFGALRADVESDLSIAAPAAGDIRSP